MRAAGNREPQATPLDLEAYAHELKKKLEERERELAEALEQQRATSEVLQVISSSPSDLEPVFPTMLGNAVHVCEAKFGALLLCDGDLLRPVARHNQPPELVVALRKLNARAYRVDQGTAMARAVRTKKIVHIADIKTEPRSYLDEPVAAVYLTQGVRTLLAVPLCQENAVLGVIVIYRQERRPFTEKQIELVKNFASQAVIAIENTRLFSELRESLQQQTATADVLKIISSSPGELVPVFEAMLANAVRICEAKFGFLWLSEGDGFRAVARHGIPPALAESYQREPVVHPAPHI